MKREAVKSDVSSMNNEVISDMPCNLSKDLSALNRSSKEKMKREALRIINSRLASYVNAANTCHMMNFLTNGKHISCFCCRPALNLSPKEKMKREAVKI